MSDPLANRNQEPSRSRDRAGRSLRGWHLAAVAALAILVDVALTGVWVVRQNEQGVHLRFGRVVRTCPAGIHFSLPFPIDSMVVVPTTEVRIMPIGFRLAETTGGKAADSQWLTGDINIVEIEAVVQFMVKDPVDYLFRVADLRVPDGAIEESRHRRFILRKLTEEAMTALTARMGVDDVLSAGKAWLQAEARRRTQGLVDELGLGLQVLAVNIRRGSAPSQVIQAFNDVSSAKADKVRAVSEADGDAKDRLPRARARADRIVQEAEIYRNGVVNAARGAAERFRQLLVEVRSAPEVSMRRMWLDVVEKGLAAARLVIYPHRDDRPFVLTEIE